MIIDRENFKREEKKLKNHHNELQVFEKVIEHIKMVKNFKELKDHPLSYLYGYEQLRGNLSMYHSFNLCKNGGTIRLIFSVDEIEGIIYLEFISMKHYEDFKIKLKGKR